METMLPEAPLVQKKHFNYVRLLGFLAGSVIAISVSLGFVAWRSPGSFAGAWGVLTLPNQLRTATLISSKKNPGRIFRPGSLALVEQKFDQRIYVFSSRGASTAVLSFLDDSSLPFLTFNNTRAKLLYNTLPFISISPNGTQVVFSQRSATSSLETRGWAVYVAPGGIGSPPTPLGVGFAGFYLDDSHVVQFTETAIYVHDLKNGNLTLLRTESFPKVPTFLSISPDRSLLAWNNVFTRTTTVYKLTQGNLVPIARVNRQLSRNAVLGDDAIYELRSGVQGSEIWKMPFDGKEEKISSLPRSLELSFFTL